MTFERQATRSMRSGSVVVAGFTRWFNAPRPSSRTHGGTTRAGNFKDGMMTPYEIMVDTRSQTLWRYVRNNCLNLNAGTALDFIRETFNRATAELREENAAKEDEICELKLAIRWYNVELRKHGYQCKWKQGKWFICRLNQGQNYGIDANKKGQ